MRQSIVNGNGATCDVCHVTMEPFEVFRLKGFILQPGPKYHEVSSDTRSRTIDSFHLCKRCYNNVIQNIIQKGK